MQAECISTQLEFEGFGRRRLVARIDGGAITSDAGLLLLRETDRALGPIERIAPCFDDGQAPDQLIHSLRTLVGQRVFGHALGYEEVNDNDQLRRNPVLRLLTERLEPKRADCAALAGKSALNRPEQSPASGDPRYCKIAHDPTALANLFFDLFVEAHDRPPRRITLDPDATDDPVHVRQEGRVFHGYYGCHCYLRLYVFCGRYLLAAKLRPSNTGASAGAVEEVARDRWPHPSALAQSKGLAAGRLRLCPRVSDDVVRSQPGRLRFRPGAQPAPGREDRRRTCHGTRAIAGYRPVRAPFQGVLYGSRPDGSRRAQGTMSDDGKAPQDPAWGQM